jgi:hypothetical protein
MRISHFNRWFKRFLPIRANTFDEFIELVKQNCTEVVIRSTELMIGDGRIAESMPTGRLANGLVYESVTRDGIKIKYLEVISSTHINTRDEALERRAIVGLWFGAHKKYELVQSCLPGLKVSLIGPNGQPIDRASTEKLYRDAASTGIHR